MVGSFKGFAEFQRGAEVLALDSSCYDSFNSSKEAAFC